MKDGYEYFANGHLITVFSATNYCGRDMNFGALLDIVDVGDTLLVTPKQIEPYNSSFWSAEVIRDRSASPMRVRR